MSQLACPLCGKYTSLSRFDPSGFESDIYAVDMIGLGRGRGFAVGPSFSVLDESTITGPIAARCRIILGLIDGVDAQSNEVSILRAEIEKFKAEALRERRDKEEVFAQLAEVESQALLPFSIHGIRHLWIISISIVSSLLELFLLMTATG